LNKLPHDWAWLWALIDRLRGLFPDWANREEERLIKLIERSDGVRRDVGKTLAERETSRHSLMTDIDRINAEIEQLRKLDKEVGGRQRMTQQDCKRDVAELEVVDY
jgi:hypothetical protein